MGDVPENKTATAAPAPTMLARGWRWIGVVLRWISVLGVIAVIAAYGEHQMEAKVKEVKPSGYIGHSDQAAYATGGVSLAEGRGLTVPYISYFFTPYSPEITRREDHWPPFMCFAIAPCVYFMGKAAWICKLPAIFFGSIGLPLTTGLLAYALSRRGYVAVFAAFVMVVHPDIYRDSLRTLSDVSTAMLVAGFAGSVIIARRHPWMHIAAGAFLAGAYFAKGSQITLLGIYPIMAMLCSGPGVLVRRSFLCGMGTALLLMAPYWYGNWKAYGEPLHSTQNYVSGFYAVHASWEAKAYFPYWGNNLPKTSDLWTKYADQYWPIVKHQRGEVVGISLAGTDQYGYETVWERLGPIGLPLRDLLAGDSTRLSPGPTEQSWGALSPTVGAKPESLASRTVDLVKGIIERFKRSPYSTSAAGGLWMIVIMIAFAPVTVAVMVIQKIVRWRRRKREVTRRTEARAVETPWMLGPVLALTFLLVAEGGFLAYLWAVDSVRFCFIFFPPMVALGCTLGSRAIEWPVQGILLALGGLTTLLLKSFGRGRKAWQWMGTGYGILRQWHVVVTLVFVTALLVDRKALYAGLDRRVAGAAANDIPDEPESAMMGAWVKTHIPNAVIMCRNPWELLFYCGPNNKGVGSPNPTLQGQAGADQILAIAHYYGVTHMYASNPRRQLEPYFSGKDGAFKRVPGAPGSLYEIDWSKIAVKKPEEVCTGK